MQSRTWETELPDSPTLASGGTRATLICVEGMGTGDLRADSCQLALIHRCLREKARKKKGDEKESRKGRGRRERREEGR